MRQDKDDLYRMLKNGHIEAHGIVDTLDAPIAVLDAQYRVISVNPAFEEVFKVDGEDMIGHPLFELGNGRWNSRTLRRLLSDIMPRATAVVGYEVVHDFPDMGPRTILVSARRLRGAGTGIGSIMVQFEEAKGHPEKDMLLTEARHRGQNLFALARALAAEAESEDQSGAEYREAFLGRFEALLKGQSLQEEFSATDFRKLADRALEPFAARIRLAPGPSVPLAATQIMPMVMVLHELMANAAKHGVLSDSQGSVHLSWQVVDGPHGNILEVHWLEEGGAPASQVARRGLGSRLMQFGVSKGLNGVSQFNFEPNGLRVSISLPVA